MVTPSPTPAGQTTQLSLEQAEVVELYFRERRDWIGWRINKAHAVVERIAGSTEERETLERSLGLPGGELLPAMEAYLAALRDEYRIFDVLVHQVPEPEGAAMFIQGVGMVQRRGGSK